MCRGHLGGERVACTSSDHEVIKGDWFLTAMQLEAVGANFRHLSLHHVAKLQQLGVRDHNMRSHRGVHGDTERGKVDEEEVLAVNEDHVDVLVESQGDLDACEAAADDNHDWLALQVPLNRAS